MKEEGNKEKKVLIIDNDESDRGLILKMRLLKDSDYSPTHVDTIDEGLEKINPEDLKVVVLNVKSAGEKGLKTLKRIRDEHPEVLVILIEALVKTIRKAMFLGAFDVTRKDDDIEKICGVLDEAFDQLSNRDRRFALPKLDEEMFEDKYSLIGQSEGMCELNKAIGVAARNTVSVLLEGETGTGKELVARLIHETSRRAGKAFVPIDCGAMSETLLESELFGHKKGAFTDAKEERLGAFRLADKGTLFLDEIHNMTPKLQKKLLRVLQEREVQPVGDDATYNVDVRIIAATNKPLAELVEKGKFRQDLYYRIDGHKISVPPLRERRDDIPQLVAYFLRRIEEEDSKLVFGISEEVVASFQKYKWPGNVRELETCLKIASAVPEGYTISLADLPEDIQKYAKVEGTERNGQEEQSPETLGVAPVYRNLFDLSTVGFCQFLCLSDVKSGVTDNQIDEWWVEFSDDGCNLANKVKRKIDDWWLDEWDDGWASVSDLSIYIKKMIDNSVSQLQDRMDPKPIVEIKPISIKGKTRDGALTAVLHEIVKAHGGDREKAAKELDIPMEQLEKRLSYIVKEYEGDSEKAAETLDISVQQLEGWVSNWNATDKKTSLRTTIEPSRKLKQFPYEEIRRLRTESIRSFASESFPPLEWEARSLDTRIQAVYLALKVLSKRLAGEHGYIYFGGMTLSQIKRGIYRRAPYLYTTPAEAFKALDAHKKAFERYWPEDKVFPTHYTLFTG